MGTKAQAYWNPEIQRKYSWIITEWSTSIKSRWYIATIPHCPTPLITKMLWEAQFPCLQNSRRKDNHVSWSLQHLCKEKDMTNCFIFTTESALLLLKLRLDSWTDSSSQDRSGWCNYPYVGIIASRVKAWIQCAQAFSLFPLFVPVCFKKVHCCDICFSETYITDKFTGVPSSATSVVKAC